jgi:hypothetical protein
VNYSGLAVGDSRNRRVPEAALPWRTGHCPVYTGQPEGGKFELESSGAPDTVRWRTGHCPVYTGQSGASRPEMPSVALCSFAESKT